jgi:gluconate 2-dehydrogenase gamma chain
VPGPDVPVLHFLNRLEAETLDAVAGRILPGDADDPGAREARATVFIDRSLSGFLRDQRTPYRVGLRGLDAYSREQHGAPFRELDDDCQDAVLAALDAGEAGEGLQHFFAVVREHVVQGTFCDPSHGGNHGTAGWRMVGFPGARWGYSAREMARDFDASEIDLVTLADLYAGNRETGA